ncbi:hypothetical protein V7O62_13620 [Methanolobus sp. ZRKC2]|uniref:4'-phosphopantetheinyl transferase family protein n=1 Tax=Methanolobus sp. ZRKC2 TaxID=3125783 RepID=UPI00325276A1
MELVTLNVSSHVSLEHVSHLWKQNDILVFIADLKDYSTLDAGHLEDVEKEHLESLKTEYFRKRFKVSRFVLKHILCILLDKQSVFDVSLYKDKYGRLHVRNHDELNICISYTENMSFLAISKTEVGIDAEIRRSLSLKKASKYLKTETSYDGRYATDLNLLTTWTLKEAYCKYSNRNIISYLGKSLDTNDIFYSGYFINNRYLLAVVTSSGKYTVSINYFEKIIPE